MEEKLEAFKRSSDLKYRTVPQSLVNAFVTASVIFGGLLAFQLAPVDERIAPPELHRLPYVFQKMPNGSEITERGVVDTYTSEAGLLTQINSWLQSRAQFASDSHGWDIPSLSPSISTWQQYDPSFSSQQPWFYPVNPKERVLMVLRERAQNEDRFEEIIDGLIFRRKLILFLLAALSMICAVVALRLKDRQLKLDADGLRFPSGLLPTLNWKRKRNWEDLSAIAIVGSPANSKGKILELYFASGGKASLHVDRFSKKDLEQLFCALDLYAPQALRSPELVAFRHEFFSSNKSEPGFTQLWEEELSANFSASNFVTLANGSTLQGGRIKTLMHLASGGLSAAYLAERGKQMVVLKESVLPKGSSPAQSEKAREMFVREASILMKLKHDSLARVLDLFKENDRDYLVLEYVPGLTLREYVRRHGPQDEKCVLAWAKQIAEILQYLHEQDPPVIHRDLTPDNLILTPAGKLVLIDFGAANRFVGTATGTIVGKQFYIAPEQFRGKAVPASDIYSLGGTLHFLLTGLDPEALSSSSPRQHNKAISEKVDEFVTALTLVDAKLRTGTALELLELLSSMEGGDSIETLPKYEQPVVLSSLEKEKLAR